MSIYFKNLDLSLIHKKRKAQLRRKTVNPFPFKLYKMLQDAHHKGWEDVVSWGPDGLSLQVHDIDRFMADVLPAYFSQTKFKSFQRQLNFYGFTRAMGATSECAYCHRFLIRGNQEMCKKIVRAEKQEKRSSPLSSIRGIKEESLPILQTAPLEVFLIDDTPLPLVQQCIESTHYSTYFESSSSTQSVDEQSLPMPQLPQEVFYTDDIPLPVVQESANDSKISTSFGFIEDDMNFFFGLNDFEIASDNSASFGGKSFHLLSTADERIIIWFYQFVKRSTI